MDTPEQNETQSQPQSQSPRQRLQALLSVPERQRTDAQWDEIIELEITLAPGNRAGAPDQHMRRSHVPGVNLGGGNKPNQGGGGGQNKQRQGKKFHKRPQKQRGNEQR